MNIDTIKVHPKFMFLADTYGLGEWSLQDFKNCGCEVTTIRVHGSNLAHRRQRETSCVINSTKITEIIRVISEIPVVDVPAHEFEDTRVEALKRFKEDMGYRFKITRIYIVVKDTGDIIVIKTNKEKTFVYNAGDDEDMMYVYSINGKKYSDMDYIELLSYIPNDLIYQECSIAPSLIVAKKVQCSSLPQKDIDNALRVREARIKAFLS